VDWLKVDCLLLQLYICFLDRFTENCDIPFDNQLHNARQRQFQLTFCDGLLLTTTTGGTTAATTGCGFTSLVAIAACASVYERCLIIFQLSLETFPPATFLYSVCAAK